MSIFIDKKPAVLLLEDGSQYRGYSIGIEGIVVGEIVFNTSMTGYQEIITDPSYTQQIITFSYPHIGNVGINRDDYESHTVWASGIVVHDCCDYPSSYRSELTMDIIDVERPKGVILQFGGQTPLKLVQLLHENNVTLLGSGHETIRKTESREAFQKTVTKLGLLQPLNATVYAIEEAQRVANILHYPLIIRPSYVIGGGAMKIVKNPHELRAHLTQLKTLSFSYPILLEHFISDAIEIDVDAVCDGTEAVICGILEHIEKAGVHSGDSTSCFPSISISSAVKEKIKNQMKKIALEIGVIGLVNAQFAVKDNQVYLIEVNARASRTIPFISKATGISWVKIAVNCMLGTSLKQQNITNERAHLFYAVKESIFPFNKLPGAIPLLGPEMKSTGEVMGLGLTFNQAFYKAQIAGGFIVPKKSLKRYVFITALNMQDMGKYTEVFALMSQLELSVIVDGKYRSYLNEYKVLGNVCYDISHIELNEMLLNGEIMFILNFEHPTEIPYLHMLQLGIKKGILYATTIAFAKIVLSVFSTPNLSTVSSIQNYTATHLQRLNL